MNLLDRFDEADVLDKTAVSGRWSISDLVGHIADWEQRMLQAAYHIYDPSRPSVLLLDEDVADWNDVMAAARVHKSWPENYHYLCEGQVAVDNFVAVLKPKDWLLRGPYPWPNDQGTLAELISQMFEHYDGHLPDLEKWYESGDHEPGP